MKVSILYDFFSWFVLQRKYSVYKKELCTIITFVKKYDYLCKHSYISVIVHTDHKLLTYFLKFNLHEKIYEHWVDKLHRLNLSIVYISDHRNKVADELSRTLFNSDDCLNDRKVQKMTIKLMKQSSHWVWRDEKEEFEELLTKLTLDERLEIIEQSTISDMFIFDLNIMTITSENVFWKQTYKHFVWFKNIYRFLIDSTSVSLAKVMRSFMNYWMIDEVLWIHYKDQYLSCVLEVKVRSLLLKAHDQADHWVKTDTLARLWELCYWLNQSEDVEKYIADCLKCACHESATRLQLLNSVKISFSFQLLDMNFIDSLTATKTENKYIFNVICYFSKKVVSFATFSVNASDVIESLKKIFTWFWRSYIIYCDRRQHFDNSMIRNFLNFKDVFISYSSSDFLKSTDMMKIFNKLLKNVFRKSFKNVDWNQTLNRVTKFINFRVISYLEISSIDIIINSIQKITSTSSTLLMLSERNIFDWVAELCLSVSHIKKIRRYIWFRSDSHDYVRTLSQKWWKDMIYKYDWDISSVYYQL